MRRSLVIAVLLLSIVSLTGCKIGTTKGPSGPEVPAGKNLKGTVTDRKPDCMAGCWIIVETKDGYSGRVDLDQDKWANCTKGTSYPICAGG